MTDFGFIKEVPSYLRTYTICGTPEYIAPEILLNKGHGAPVDWWCLGILMYELTIGVTPFYSEDPVKIYDKITKCKIKFPFFFSSKTKSLIKHLIVADLS